MRTASASVPALVARVVARVVARLAAAAAAAAEAATATAAAASAEAATASATTASATAEAATTAASAATLALTRLVDDECPTAKVGAVHCFDGALAVLHLHEAETAGAAGFPIDDDLAIHDIAVGRKGLPQLVFGAREGKVTDIQAHAHEPILTRASFITSADHARQDRPRNQAPGRPGSHSDSESIHRDGVSRGKALARSSSASPCRC